MARAGTDHPGQTPTSVAAVADVPFQPSERLSTNTLDLNGCRPRAQLYEDADPNPLADSVVGDRKPTLGDYEILAEVGRGGMGIVYKARHRGLNRIVALKVTLGRESLSEDRARRFQSEAAAIAKLDHPNIVPIYEIGEAEGQQFFSMAFVEGASLDHLVSRGPLPPRHAADLLRTVALAIAYAHSQGVIHRDLKPDNILLDSSGRPRITDFGIAKCMNEESRLTQDGQIIGTPSYMPPEQAQGSLDQVGPTADVYSLGATLYCLVTGRPPFQAATPLESLKQVLERDPVSPRQLNPAVDRDLETICLKCLEKSSDRRYATATALADDLKRFLEQRPIQARPVDVFQKALRWCWRNPLPTMFSVSTVAVFVTAFVLVALSYKHEAHERADAYKARDAERWERFRANMATVASAFQSQNLAVARRALEAAPPELRNWEWFHFHQLLDGSQRVLDGHQLGVSRVLFLNHGRVLTDDERQLRIWDAADGRVVQTHAYFRVGEFGPLSLSSDRRCLAYQVNERDICIWDLEADRRQARLIGVEKPCRGLNFNADGSRLISCSVDNRVHIWDTSTGELLKSWPMFEETAEIQTFHISHRHVGASRVGEHAFHIWNSETGKKKAVLEGHVEKIIAVCINSREDRVVTSEGYPSTIMRLWDLATGEQLATLNAHTNQIHDMRFSPDDTRIASFSFDQTVGLWDAETGTLVASLKGHGGRVYFAEFSPDSKRIVSTSEDQTVRLWDAVTGNPISVLRGHTGDIFTAAYAPDGSTIVSGATDRTARLWDVRLAERNGVLRGHTGYVYDVAFHPDGERVASVSWDGTARIWSAANGVEIARFSHGNNAIIAGVSIHPAGKMIATIGRDDAVRLLDCETATLLHQWKVPTNCWRDGRLKFSPRGDLLAAAGSDGAVHLLDVATRTPIGRLACENHGPVLDVAFSPDGRWLASGGAHPDNTIHIWDVQKRDLIQILRGHADVVYALAFSPDGKLLASGSPDNTVRLWDTDIWKELAVLRHGAKVYGIAFHPDGSRLATACGDNSIRFWDVARCQEVAELRGHGAYVHSLAFSPDGSRLVTGSGDSTVRIWDTLSAEERPASATTGNKP